MELSKIIGLSFWIVLWKVPARVALRLTRKRWSDPSLASRCSFTGIETTQMAGERYSTRFAEFPGFLTKCLRRNCEVRRFWSEAVFLTTRKYLFEEGTTIEGSYRPRMILIGPRIRNIAVLYAFTKQKLLP